MLVLCTFWHVHNGFVHIYNMHDIEWTFVMPCTHVMMQYTDCPWILPCAHVYHK
jgi:hypothetical protein